MKKDTAINDLVNEAVTESRKVERYEPHFTQIERTIWFEKEFKPVESYVVKIDMR